MSVDDDDAKKKNGSPTNGSPTNGAHVDPPAEIADRLNEWDENATDEAPAFLPGFNDPRIIVHMTTMLAEVVDRAVDLLQLDHGIFQRDGRLVRVVGASTPNEDLPATTPKIAAGTPQVRDLPIPNLKDRITRIGRFQRYDGRKKKNPWVDALPTDLIIKAIDARGHSPNVRELAGIIESPSMRPDGSLLVTPGYDAATRYLYAPRIAFPEILHDPTPEDAKNALLELQDVFCDFPFASEAAALVPIAALFTLIARPAIEGACPAFLFDAPTPGTGKSLCADAVCTIATGRSAPRATFPTNVEELEKVIASYVMQSASVIGFDNLESGFGGAPIDKLLTAVDTVDFRVLGKTESLTMLARAVVMASGNDLAVLRDCVRRVLMCRILSPLAKPEERTGFKHSPLLPWTLTHRPRLIAAALTVLRAYVFAGSPDPLPALGSFEAWTALVPSAIRFAGGANVLDARVSADSGDTGEAGAIAALLRHWRRLDEGRGITVRNALHALYPGKRAEGPPDGFDDLREAIEFFVPPIKLGLPPDAKKVGFIIRRFRERNVGGLRLMGAPDRNGLVMWRVENVQ